MKIKPGDLFEWVYKYGAECIRKDENLYFTVMKNMCLVRVDACALVLKVKLSTGFLRMVYSSHITKN